MKEIAKEQRPTDADQRLVITKIIDVYNARYPALLGYQTDLAKWMLATLSLVNGGAIAALFHEERLPRAAEIWGSPFFAFGVALAIGSGLFSWINTNIAISVYDDIINPNAITDLSAWKVVREDDPRHCQIARLAKWAIGSGIGSLLAGAAGSFAVWLHL